MPSGGGASSRQALSEEQRQQIISKLLAERRSQPGRQQPALPEEERAARLQELINRRAAAKQQQEPNLHERHQHSTSHDVDEGLPGPRQQEHPKQHSLHHHHQHHQQQPQYKQHHHHQQRQSQQQQRQRHHVPQVGSATSSMHASQDLLLSPGSTSSLASALAAAAAAARAGGRASSGGSSVHIRHRQQQQQQHGSTAAAAHDSTAAAAHDSSSDSSTGSQSHAAAGQHYAPRQQQQHQPQLPQQQQQHRQQEQLLQRPRPRSLQQQQQQQQQRGGSTAARGVLHEVLDGPVDISDLWASHTSLADREGSADTHDTLGDSDAVSDSNSSGSHHGGGGGGADGGGSWCFRSAGGSSDWLGSSLLDELEGLSDGEGGDSLQGAGAQPGSSARWGSASQAPAAAAGSGGARGPACSSGGGRGAAAAAARSSGGGAAAARSSGGGGASRGRAVTAAPGVASESGADEPKWQLSGSLSFVSAHQANRQAAGHHQQQPQQSQQRLMQLRQLHQELQEHRQRRASTESQQQQRQQQQSHYHQPTPPAQPRQLQQQQAGESRSPHLPSTYPSSRAERLQQLAQPKGANRQKYDQMKADAEHKELQKCSFRPQTGRGPQHRCSPAGSVAERLYQAAAEKKARLEQKAAELASSSIEVCTFTPQTNAAANARVLERYEYVPLHKRLGQVLRSRSEKLAHIQQQVEAEVHSSATFTPRINPRSSTLALQRSRSCSRAGGEGDCGLADMSSPGGRDSSPCAAARCDSDVGRSRSRSRTARLRRTWSEREMSRQCSRPHPDDACTFSPSINARSEALLHASGEIPLSFLQRQEYFDKLAREKRQLLQLAVEDQHCSFVPAAGTRSSSRSGRSDRGASLDQEPFLDRIERLAYSDRRRVEASRSALADSLHNSECTFRPAINPRSARMAKPTPLQELYENNKGRLRRDSVALAVELQQEAECTFTPNLAKPGVRSCSPVEAQLSLSAEEVECVVARLYPDQRAKEVRVGEAASYQQYQELKACTFQPEINRSVPQTQGPVLVRGLGRFLELKDMARQQAEAKAAVEAKVFITHPKQPTAPFTTPQPFRFGPAGASGAEMRRRREVAEAQAAELAECTFAPRINTHHKTRQQRVAELLGTD